MKEVEIATLPKGSLCTYHGTEYTIVRQGKYGTWVSAPMAGCASFLPAHTLVFVTPVPEQAPVPVPEPEQIELF